jgi:16S rRNA (guanine(966)-N(2))-methyltransferase RsmD
MRVTGGILKGFQLNFGFAEHVRPSTDFMREGIFNFLMHEKGIENMEVLDLFSGSGIVSLEFLSRDANSVLSVDADIKNVKFQQKIKKEHQLESWEIVKDDVFKFLNNNTKTFDLVFADPPYDLPNIQNIDVFGRVYRNQNSLYDTLYQKKKDLENEGIEYSKTKEFDADNKKKELSNSHKRSK